MFSGSRVEGLEFRGEGLRFGVWGLVRFRGVGLD